MPSAIAVECGFGVDRLTVQVRGEQYRNPAAGRLSGSLAGGSPDWFIGSSVLGFEERPRWSDG